MTLIAKFVAVAIAMIAALVTVTVPAGGQILIRHDVSIDSCMAASPAGVRGSRPHC